MPNLDNATRSRPSPSAAKPTTPRSTVNLHQLVMRARLGPPNSERAEVRQARMFSELQAAQYLAEHRYVDTDAALSDNAILAMGRLAWLLAMTRGGLSDVFTAAEAALLLACNQSNIYFPEQFLEMASDLSDMLGIDQDKYRESDAASLIEKLLTLDTAQRLALADTLEQVWNLDLKRGLSVLHAFAARGIRLL